MALPFLFPFPPENASLSRTKAVPFGNCHFELQENGTDKKTELTRNL